MSSWEFTAPIIVRSQNKLYGSHRNHSAHRREYARVRDTAYTALLALRHYHCIPRAAGKRRIAWTRILGHRENLFDDPNMVGGLKPVIDAAAAAGLLVNDTREYYVGRYDQDDTRPLYGPQLHVLIEELEELEETSC